MGEFSHVLAKFRQLGLYAIALNVYYDHPTIVFFKQFPSLQDIEFLTSSIGQLKVSQNKFVDAKDSLNVLNKNNKGEWTCCF